MCIRDRDYAGCHVPGTFGSIDKIHASSSVRIYPSYLANLRKGKAYLHCRHKNMEKMAEEYGKTSVQKKYLEKKYNEIKLPDVYKRQQLC